LKGFVDAKAKKPITRQSHYDQLKKSGIIKREYEVLPFPDELTYLYNWYADLTWFGVGIVELQSYFSMKRIEPTRQEFETLVALIKINRGQ
jgi:hypothetical protein